MAELVDARDLKFFAPLECSSFFWKTPAASPIENDRTIRDLENRFSRCGQVNMDIEKALQIVRDYRPKKATPPKFTRLPGAENEAAGIVYFIYSGGRIKIGYTTDVPNRKSTLACQSPMPTTVLMVMPGDLRHEEDWHDIFAVERLHGEWFDLSPGLRAFLIEKLCDAGIAALAKAEAEFEEIVMNFAANIMERDLAIAEASPPFPLRSGRGNQPSPQQ